jgi:PAS domain S-box-containing protein
VTLPRSVKFLIVGASLLGLGCVAIRVPEIRTWDASDLLAVALIASFTIAAERCSIPLRRGSETVNFALTDGVWAGALILVLPSVLTIAVLLGVAIGQALNRWSPYKIAYNVSQFLIGITIAEAAFDAMTRVPSVTDSLTWAAVLCAMYLAFACNASAIMLVVSMVEGSRFRDVFRLPLALNVFHWLGNMALGILGALLIVQEPIALALLTVPITLAYITYRRWVDSIAERDQMRDLYEAGRALFGPLSPSREFSDFLGLLERLLPADSVELVVVDGDVVSVHARTGERSFTVNERGSSGPYPLEALVPVRSGIAPQISLVADDEDVRGVLAVYRTEPLGTNERLLLDGLAGQIAVRLQNYRLYGETLERARLSEIVTQTSDGVFAVDQHGRVTTWNPAMHSIVGYTEHEAIGRRCEDLLGLENLDAVTAADAPNVDPSDALVRKKDGATTSVRLRTSTIRDREGAPRSYIVILREASEETRAEQLKRDFVSMVSHELRTPLTPLKGFLKSLLEGSIDDSPEARREYYHIMLRQAQRLERLVGDMLDASQIDAGGLVIDLEAVSLTPLLTRLVSDFVEQRGDRVVTLHGVEDRLVTLADPFRVEQVVLNLLTNADKYTPADLPIDVFVTQQDRAAVISVRDRGEGIPLEHQTRIFDRFFRVSDGTGSRRPGTGLGLYIARSLVEAMSGRIWVDSEVGVGSTFSFSLPTVDVRFAESRDERRVPAKAGNLMAV